MFNVGPFTCMYRRTLSQNLYMEISGGARGTSHSPTYTTEVVPVSFFGT